MPLLRSLAVAALLVTTSASADDAAAPRSTHAGRDRRVYLTVASAVDQTRRGGPQLGEQLRAAMTDAIARSGSFTQRSTAGGFTVDASVTALEHRVDGRFDNVTAEISLIIARLPQKSIVGLTKVTATAQWLHAYYKPEMERDLQQQAVEGAAQGAPPTLLAVVRGAPNRR